VELSPGKVTRHAWLARRGEAFTPQPPLHFLKTATGWQAVA
jgi:hypothetical protein